MWSIVRAVGTPFAESPPTRVTCGSWSNDLQQGANCRRSPTPTHDTHASISRLLRNSAEMVRDLAHLAVIGKVSQPRISQILSLLLLAPDIQEALLFHPRVTLGKPSISEKALRPIVAIVDWDEQWEAWKSLEFGDFPIQR